MTMVKRAKAIPVRTARRSAVSVGAKGALFAKPGDGAVVSEDDRLISTGGVYPRTVKTLIERAAISARCEEVNKKQEEGESF
jgi:hypothetical protein